MSNERIDLTQFENISSEGWEYLSDESRNINDAALDKIPELIAELKRCYEELDRMKRQRDVAEHAILVLQDFVSEKDIPEIEKRLNAYHE